jgi:hypothetical protein
VLLLPIYKFKDTVIVTAVQYLIGFL